MDNKGKFISLLIITSVYLLLIQASWWLVLLWILTFIIGIIVSKTPLFWPPYILLHLFHPWSIFSSPSPGETLIANWAIWIFTLVLLYAWITQQHWQRFKLETWLLLIIIALYIWAMINQINLPIFLMWLGQLCLVTWLGLSFSSHVKNRSFTPILLWSIVIMVVFDHIFAIYRHLLEVI